MRYFFYLLGLFSLILVISLIYLGFHHPNTSSVKSVAMSDYANTNASVSFTINGFTTGDESHRIIKITINNQSRMIEILSGYQGNVINSSTTPNNVAAFQAFLAGLQTEGYNLQRKDSVSLLGQCPLGDQDIFDTSGISNVPSELWTTTCSASDGTFAGDFGNVQQLFQNQIPDYGDFVAGVTL
jgi:hypothetical protein